MIGVPAHEDEKKKPVYPYTILKGTSKIGHSTRIEPMIKRAVETVNKTGEPVMIQHERVDFIRVFRDPEYKIVVWSRVPQELKEKRQSS